MLTVYVFSAYSWFTNFTSRQTSYTTAADPTTMINNEPDWPRRNSDCTSAKTVIAHTILKDASGGPSLDFSHGTLDGHFLGTRPTGKSGPVGFADGHVTSRKTDDMMGRVVISVSISSSTDTHWY